MTDPDPKTGRFSLWSVILISCVVASASAGAGWTVGRTLLGDELDQFRATKSWKVQDAIRQIGALSEQLNVTLEQRNQLEDLRKSASEAVSRNQELEQIIADKSAYISALEEKMKFFQSDEISIDEGKTRFLMPNELPLGVSMANPYAHLCKIKISGNDSDMSPGSMVQMMSTKGAVTITLLSVDNKTCHFSIVR